MAPGVVFSPSPQSLPCKCKWGNKIEPFCSKSRETERERESGKSDIKTIRLEMMIVLLSLPPHILLLFFAHKGRWSPDMVARKKQTPDPNHGATWFNDSKFRLTKDETTAIDTTSKWYVKQNWVPQLFTFNCLFSSSRNRSTKCDPFFFHSTFLMLHHTREGTVDNYAMEWPEEWKRSISFH